ncbi:MAG: peptidyl-prolyl cis-trans isomerase, partial [Planctomycetes bacterium]|nr:peptidyl-prolyl cis-trans isomerase [Planctomycetota bacterium]
MMKSLLREPLLHFLVLAGGLFALWAVRNPESTRGEPSRPQITISEARIDSLIDIFAKARHRPPTQQELAGLIDDFLQEEVFYREALAMKLDEDDTIVRRRLRQKMELFVEDFTSAAQPTAEQLADFLQEQADQFRVDRRVAFRHVYLNPEKHPDTLDKDLETLKAELERKADPAELGDTFLLPGEFELTSLRQLTQLFGEDFGPQVYAQAAGAWQGPVSSGFGVHLVWIVAKEEGRLPALG